MLFRILATGAALALFVPTAGVAQDDKAKPPVAAKDYVANSASKTLSGTFGGRSMRYTATVEEQVLKDDKRFIVSAASHAQKAVDHLHRLQPV